HDDLLEDLSRSAIDSRIREFGGWRRRLDGIAASGLKPEERLDRRMLGNCIRSRLYALEEVRDWERNPLVYAEVLANSLATQVLFEYADLPERARRVGSKLRQTPRLIEAARENVSEAPGLFVKVAIESFEGVLSFIDKDLPRVFRNLDDLHILGDLADASTDAAASLREYIGYLRDTLAPKSRATFRIGRDQFEQKLRFDEGIDIPSDQLLDIALRELRATQEEFARIATTIDRDPAEAWRKVKLQHPSADELIPAVGEQVQKLQTFLQRKPLVTLPESAGLRIAPTPDFYRWTFASLWTAGPFEVAKVPARYYITNVDPEWSDSRKKDHLLDLNYASLWSVSTHEVYPGHFLHFEHLRQVKSRLRKSTLCAPTSFIEGWAHYAEQMILDEGFEHGNAEIRLGQLAEALTRLARTIVGIRLHAEDLSVEQGVRFFKEEAYLEEGTARQEAERGTFDPSYVLYALGKQMMVKLRTDAEEAARSNNDGFSLQRFHDNVLGHGSVPFWMHRALMGRDEPVIE
ncbi:MAG: DUF885 domain-containing protein, partial [Vicinamibacterales bacterium]